MYLVVREESSGSGFFAGFATAVCWGVQAVLLIVGQRERLAVHRHSHYDFLAIGALFDPVINSEILRLIKQRKYSLLMKWTTI